MIIQNRRDAEIEVAKVIRRDRIDKAKYGSDAGIDERAVRFRRDNAARFREIARQWRERGNMVTAVSVAKAARAQLIIARGIERYLNGTT